MSGSPTPSPDRSRFVLAGAMALAGIVWALQGLGAPIGGSFMVGDRFWTYAGLATIGAAAALAIWPRLRRR